MLFPLLGFKVVEKKLRIYLSKTVVSVQSDRNVKITLALLPWAIASFKRHSLWQKNVKGIILLALLIEVDVSLIKCFYLMKMVAQFTLADRPCFKHQTTCRSATLALQTPVKVSFV